MWPHIVHCANRVGKGDSVPARARPVPQESLLESNERLQVTSTPSEDNCESGDKSHLLD
jgi:hypothetical protein